MVVITVVVDVQVVIPPADGECGGYTPEKIGSEVMIRCIGIIVNRIRGGIVVIDRLALVNNNFLWHVVRHIDDRFTGLGDYNAIVAAGNFLKRVRFQIASGIGELAK